MADIQETFRAHTVLEHAKSTVSTLFAFFDAAMKERGGGAPSDDEQDLLRAALVFAAAGLDSSLKELLRATTRPLAGIDRQVQTEFETFVQRQLRGDTEETESPTGYKFLATILSSPSPQGKLLDEYVLYLTGTSLQSVEQLFKAARALGVEINAFADQKAKLTVIFDTRNKIIHELDVRFVGKRGHRQRNSRRRPDLEDYCDTLIKVAELIITSVEKKLTATAS